MKGGATAVFQADWLASVAPFLGVKGPITNTVCPGQVEIQRGLPYLSDWEYSGAGVTVLDIDYRTEPIGSQYIVVDPWDEIVGRYTSAEEAQQNIERCKKEYAIAATAYLLVENAIKALMQLNGVDRDTAERAIRDVMGGACLRWKQFF
jgi:hypothetical protein